METKRKKGLMVAVALISIIVVGFGAGCIKGNNSVASDVIADIDLYIIETISDDMIMVSGIKPNSYESGGNYEVGYGHAFRQALREISENYYVLDITPLEYRRLQGTSGASFTKELIVIVEPKKLSE